MGTVSKQEIFVSCALDVMFQEFVSQSRRSLMYARVK